MFAGDDWQDDISEDDLWLTEQPEEDEDWFDEEDSKIDMSEFDLSAERKIIFTKSSLVGPIDDLVPGLILEGELALGNGEYRSALVCSLAAQKLLSPATSDSCKVIEMICMYQLGDRHQAQLIMDSIDPVLLSPFLKKKFLSTCEVIKFMPQLLGLLKQQTHGDGSSRPRRF
jgi:hypothetical protein